MDITVIELQGIKPYPENPRRSEESIAAVAASIAEFGFNQPLVLDAEHVIVVGHTRYYAAIELGFDALPCWVNTRLTPEQAKAYRLADNRTNELATWDDPKLLAELQALETSFDMAAFGFGAKDMSRLLLHDAPEHTLPNEATEGDEDTAPAPPKQAKTKMGDVYEIGQQRLICGDSLEFKTYKALLGDELVDMVFTDPPYNVAYQGKTGDKLKIKNDDMSTADFRQFLLAFYLCVFKFSKAGTPLYVCFAECEWYAFRGMMEKAGWTLKQCLVWVKSQFTLGRSDYQFQHEPILYGVKPGAPTVWLGGRNQTTVWEVPKPPKNDVHPTMKPVALVEKALRNSSRHGAVVLDPFGGSGTTLVACQKLGRKGRSIELDPAYCDVIVERLRGLWPQLPATKNGEPFK
jgi:site-specific DNA-methyltransferase (adenine-specific)